MRCVVMNGRAEFGATALLAVALYDLRMTRDSEDLRALHRALLDFLVQQQRPDGEMMHEFDLTTNQPVDVQRMYYSGEAALALVRGAAIEQDERYIDAAVRLVRLLGEAPRQYVGHAYLMGEDHWTCIAYGDLRSLLERDVPAAREYCHDWAAYSRGMQFRRGETLWDVEGIYGLVPFFRPPLTAAASRTEAFAALGLTAPEDEAVRGQVIRGVQVMMANQFHLGDEHTPGSPVYMMRNPARMVGGITGAVGKLLVRNDYVQHAGSAYLRTMSMLEAADALAAGER